MGGFSKARDSDGTDKFEQEMVQYVGFTIRHFTRHYSSKVIPLPNTTVPIVRFDSKICGPCDLMIKLHK